MKNLIFRLVSLSSRSGISTACRMKLHGRFYLHVWAPGLCYRHCHQSTSELPPLIAGQPLHRPVMLNEVLHCLDIQPGQVKSLYLNISMWLWDLPFWVFFTHICKTTFHSLILVFSFNTCSMCFIVSNYVLLVRVVLL